MLTNGQIEAYRRDGYLVIPRLIQGEQLSDLRALTHAERNLVQKDPAVGEFVAHSRDIDMAHAHIVAGCRSGPHPGFDLPSTTTLEGAHRKLTDKASQIGNMSKDRDTRSRRTRMIRNGVIGVGTVGALGAATAIGVTTTTHSSNTDTSSPQTNTSSPNNTPSRHGDDFGEHDGEDRLQPPTNQGSTNGNLAGPSNNGPSQGHSSGS